MAKGLYSVAFSAIRRVEVGVVSGARGLIRPHPKSTLGDLQGFAQLISLHPGGVAWGHGSGPEPSTWTIGTYLRSQSVARMCAP